ncbi:MAG: tRNA (N(6)-L-threonylcarbamoyladenosine(37)-C(2))-methylthiotransferase MtaB [Bacteroidia bacterium]|nr:tRNA (N(6)-L-threonylcarbamoyladenosine(37)-C(2))-methylthiotransferase MtaB [Bacteroidia bacterium]MCF8448143.1 tRNA (N(6)-L-threonylcarbamoyladenosine(37)-C(2))-methylthiotransferase MtaB [Bacteroidia bacterium]
MSKTVAFYTLGCKLNFSETSTIGRNLSEHGYQKVDFHAGADVYVINTCSVTDHADKKCKKIVKEALRHNPNAFVSIIGCYAQLKPQEIAKIEGVDLVLGAAEKFNIQEYIGNGKKKEIAEVKEGKIKEVLEYHSSYSMGDRTRTFLKVQDGCDYFCSFCTIPLARGSSRSDTIANVVKQAQEIVAQGSKEIVLTGVNTGDFGAGTQENFFQLLQALDKVNGLERLRISSIEPNLLTDEIIEFAAQSKTIVPHFHIPLQSGSDELLKSMRRKYDTDLYTSRIQKIKSLMPHCCIGVDVIIGYPGETDELFLETYNYLNELPISYLHVFTYSERANTTANKLPGKVLLRKRNERSKMLHILSDKKRNHFYEEQIGKTFPVLWEAENDADTMYGFTSNYVKVKTAYEPSLVNEIMEMELTHIDEDRLVKGKLFAFSA